MHLGLQRAAAQIDIRDDAAGRLRDHDLALSAGYDFADGTRTSATDPNGISFTMQFDARGRLIRTNNPDGTASTRSFNECTLFGCENGTGPNELILIDKTLDTAGNPITERWTYTDELLRPLVVTRQTLNWGWNRVNLEYDKEQNLKRQTAPFWWGGGTAYWTQYSFDRLNRPTQVSRPISDSDPTLQTQTTYYEGLKTRVVDANGKEKSTIRTVVGGIARSADHDGYYQAFDFDAFGNAVRVMDSAGLTLQTGTFDVVGLRTASTDADRGSWSYAFDSLGEMTSQTDANAKTMTWAFDALGRMTQRQEPLDTGTVTATWTWGTVADNTASNKYIGRLKSHSISGTVYVTTYSETNTFDQFGRLIQTKYTDGAGPTDYYVDREYQSWTGYLNSLTYPDSGSGYRLRLQYEYQAGELKRIKDYNATWYTFWEANANNARGQNIEEQNGNGIKTVMGFDEVTGRMDYIQSGLWGGTGLQNLSYAWDKAGNLTQRQDNNQGLTENFYYDNLYRLDYSTLNGSTNLDLSYAPNGNITWKSDAGSYYYAPGRPHAVDSVTGGPIGNKYYAYDSVGNQTWNAGQSLTYYTNGLLKYAYLDAGNNSFFQYGADGQRWKHDYAYQGATYNHTYIDKLFEKVYDSGSGKTTYKHYLFVNGAMFALKMRDSWGGDTTNYLHADHLGSTSNITDASGNSMVGASYDAFGDRRGIAWTGDPASWEVSALNTVTRRGFTEHEMMDSTALVHMNGRVYNPVTARFVSADPFIDGGAGTQGWNRYSYVGNRAASLLDPTGFAGFEGAQGWVCFESWIFEEQSCGADRGSHTYGRYPTETLPPSVWHPRGPSLGQFLANRFFGDWTWQDVEPLLEDYLPGYALGTCGYETFEEWYYGDEEGTCNAGDWTFATIGAIPLPGAEQAAGRRVAIQASVRAGAAGEAAVRAAFYIGPEKKTAIRISETLLRFPDGLDQVAQVLTEVKNVRKFRQRDVEQLQDYVRWAQREGGGWRVDLYVRPGATPGEYATDLGPEIRQLVEEGLINLKPIPFN